MRRHQQRRTGAVSARHARPALFALASTYVHFGAQVGIVALPTSLLGWGATAVSTGFALLGLSLLVSWSLRDRHSSSSA